MTQKEAEMKADAVMKAFLDKLNDVIDEFNRLPIYGPIIPALQRFEEARMWLRKCIESHNEHIKEIHEL